MITYSPGYWGVCFSLTCNGSVLPKAAVWAVPCAIATFLLHGEFHLDFEDWGSEDIGVQIMASFTFVLGFLIVFRVTQAYSRWWEGGTLLLKVRGEWFNAYSSVIALCNTSDEKAAEVRQFQSMLCRLMSLLYGSAVLQVCTAPDPALEIVELKGFDGTHLKYLEHCHDKVEVILQWIQRSVVAAADSQVVKAAPPILTRFYNQLGNGMSILVSARKIGEFPIPFPVAQLITIMLMFNWVCTVTVAVMAIRSPAWAALLAFSSTLCLWSINYLAIELEMPFGDDLNDLPLAHLQADMNASLMGLLHPSALMAPAFKLDPSNAELRSQKLSFKRDGGMALEASEVSRPGPAENKQGCLCAKICRRKTLTNSADDNGGFQPATRVAQGRKKGFERNASANEIGKLIEEYAQKIQSTFTFTDNQDLNHAADQDKVLPPGQSDPFVLAPERGTGAYKDAPSRNGVLDEQMRSVALQEAKSRDQELMVFNSILSELQIMNARCFRQPSATL